ncbi:MAG: YdcF family protein [Oscillospiraceae bacterium]|nr:YdcF family protein [Oscillospiraceae bacterium]
MKKRILKWTALVLAAMCLYTLFCAGSIVLYAQTDERRKADCIIVLGAGTNGKTPNAVFRERLNHAVTLYNEGYAEIILLTGGLTPGNAHSDSYIAGQYLLELGIPAEAVLLEERSTITQENLKFAKEIMDSHELSTAILVSDPLHMKRSMTIAKDYEIEAFSSPTPTTRYRTWKTKLPFLARETFFYVGYQVYRIFVKA